ncbi:MAG: hypothetical protein JNK15_19855 [Planctomycetes bacterium]|nr:hypothetical protein [Planctomycetota bacterium]
MTPHVRSLRLVGSFVAAMALAGCHGALPAPQHFEETPAGSGTWVPIAAAPAFATKVPQRAGFLRFVATGRSNLRSIAAGPGEPSATAMAQTSIRQVLVTVVGAPFADAAASAAAQRLTLVQRACCDEVLTHDPVPGNTLSTAWAMWEVSFDDVLAAVPAAERSAVRAVLDEFVARQ